MSYTAARELAPGALVRTDDGDEGVVLTTVDAGVSVLLEMRRDDGRVLAVHSAQAWPRRAEGGPPGRH